MTILDSQRPRTAGPIGRLGGFAADHVRAITIAWAVAALVLAAFAPKVETALSGAGWQADGSESVQARTLIERSFAGRSSSALTVVVHSASATTSAPGFRSALAGVERVLATDARVGPVQRPRPGATISADGHTAVVTAGAKGDPTAMVAAAGELGPRLERAGSPSVSVALTGSPATWSAFNTANKTAMMKSELLSWPVTLIIIVLAFGSLVAAGLPLLLTILGLVSSAGLLALLTAAFDISIWAMNFALMFSLALGIDYALFIVHRFRASLHGSGLGARDAVVATMDTAGKAVVFSAMTVLVSLSAVLLVPSPAFRSTALGIMLSVAFVLAATLTLLPAVLAKLGPRIDALPLGRARSRADRSPRSARWGARLWRQAHLFGPVAAIVLVVLALPVLGLKTGMPSINVVPRDDDARVGYAQLQRGFGDGAPGALQIAVPQRDAAAAAAVARRDPGVARVLGPEPGADGLALIGAVPRSAPSSAAAGRTIDRLRGELPPAAVVGGQAAENHDLASALRRKTPLVIGAVLALGFLLLLIVVQAPLIAALAVVTNLLATAAAFGAGRLIFQDGHGSGLLGFEPQGYMDAWAPVFFFVMIFAISMDYTVFLLASARAHWDRTHDPRAAAVGGLADSGRVIFAAAAVMVAVFFTFALSGPLPPKEMGVILGVSVLLDAMLVRLVLLPALMRAFGRFAWALPRRIGRVLPAVRFGHA
jgi:putative drug exporter of the RND superfamily